MRRLGPCHVCEGVCEYMGGAPHVGGVTEYCFECGLPTCAVHLSTSDEGNGDECHDCGALRGSGEGWASRFVGCASPFIT